MPRQSTDESACGPPRCTRAARPRLVPASSGCPDSNRGPPAPKAGALTKLRHTPLPPRLPNVATRRSVREAARPPGRCVRTRVATQPAGVVFARGPPATDLLVRGDPAPIRDWRDLTQSLMLPRPTAKVELGRPGSSWPLYRTSAVRAGPRRAWRWGRCPAQESYLTASCWVRYPGHDEPAPAVIKVGTRPRAAGGVSYARTVLARGDPVTDLLVRGHPAPIRDWRGVTQSPMRRQPTANVELGRLGSSWPLFRTSAVRASPRGRGGGVAARLDGPTRPVTGWVRYPSRDESAPAVIKVGSRQ